MVDRFWLSVVCLNTSEGSASIVRYSWLVSSRLRICGIDLALPSLGGMRAFISKPVL